MILRIPSLRGDGRQIMKIVEPCIRVSQDILTDPVVLADQPGSNSDLRMSFLESCGQTHFVHKPCQKVLVMACRKVALCFRMVVVV